MIPALVDFLRARLNEEEARAQAAVVPAYDFMTWEDCVLVADRETTPAQDDFVTGWPPARVLAECHAKRQVVENHARRFKVGGELHDAQTLRWLTVPYADHPDYRQEWRP